MSLLQVVSNYGSDMLPSFPMNPAKTTTSVSIPALAILGGILSFAVCMLILFFVIRLAVRYGMRDHDRDVEKYHRNTMPFPQQMPPQVMPPQGMPPQGMPPQGMPQHNLNYQGRPYNSNAPQFNSGVPNTPICDDKKPDNNTEL